MDPSQTDKLTCTVWRPEGHLEVHSEAQLVSSEHPQSLHPLICKTTQRGGTKHRLEATAAIIIIILQIILDTCGVGVT